MCVDRVVSLQHSHTQTSDTGKSQLKWSCDTKCQNISPVRLRRHLRAPRVPWLVSLAIGESTAPVRLTAHQRELFKHEFNAYDLIGQSKYVASDSLMARVHWVCVLQVWLQGFGFHRHVAASLTLHGGSISHV